MPTVRGLALAAGALAVAGGLAVAFHYTARARPASALRVGSTLPEFDLPTLGHEGRVRTADVRRHPTVLGILDTRWPNFYDAVEGLERVNRALRGRGLLVVGVFVDEDPAAAREFARTQPATFTTAHDPRAAALAPRDGPPAAAELLVVVGGRIVVRSTEVAAWRTPAFRASLEPFVEPEKPPANP
jgi:hypothetical protein